MLCVHAELVEAESKLPGRSIESIPAIMLGSYMQAECGRMGTNIFFSIPLFSQKCIKLARITTCQLRGCLAADRALARGKFSQRFFTKPHRRSLFEQ